MNHRVLLNKDKIVDWETFITLKPEALALLESLAGMYSEPGWFYSEDELKANIEDPNGEPWGWTPYWDSGVPAKMTTQVCFWFRDPEMATYFKLLWGGQ